MMKILIPDGPLVDVVGGAEDAVDAGPGIVARHRDEIGAGIGNDAGEGCAWNNGGADGGEGGVEHAAGVPLPAESSRAPSTALMVAPFTVSVMSEPPGIGVVMNSQA